MRLYRGRPPLRQWLVVLVSFALYVGKANGMSQHAQSWNGKKWADVHVETNAEQYPGPQMPPAQVMPDNPLIFLGTSAYRDIRCGRTVFEAFEKAKHPENIRVGVVDQLGPGDTPCMDSYCKLSEEKHDGKCMYKDHITVTTKDFLDSRGPCPARALQQKMINAEDFCFQVDSHTMLIEDWDEKLIAEWVKTENEYAILSTYCRRIEEYGQNINGVHEVPHLCTTVWGANDMVRNGDACSARLLERPKLTWTWGAGLSFGKCHAEKNVPYDPHLNNIFDGEEFSRAIRLWTHGYDVYTPSDNYVFHDYFGVLLPKGEDSVKGKMRWSFSAPKEDEAVKEAETALAVQRLRTLLRMPGGDGQELGAFGLGLKRTYEMFVEYSGVDPSLHQASTGDYCGDLVWVPWVVGADTKISTQEVDAGAAELVGSLDAAQPSLAGALAKPEAQTAVRTGIRELLLHFAKGHKAEGTQVQLNALQSRTTSLTKKLMEARQEAAAEKAQRQHLQWDSGSMHAEKLDVDLSTMRGLLMVGLLGVVCALLLALLCLRCMCKMCDQGAADARRGQTKAAQIRAR